ncbi:MAG: hypothetical protein ACRCVT_07915 [Leadbetterella sp.]
MKNVFLVALLVLSFCAKSIGQISLEQTIDTYMKLNERKEIDSLMEYIYPGVFSLFPKASLAKVMKDAINSEDFTIDLSNLKTDSLGQQKLDVDIKYQLLYYSMTMTLTYKEKQSEDILMAVKNSFNNLYGEENVKLNQELSSLEVFSSKKMLAILDPKYDGWKLLGIEPQQKFMLKKILPEKIFKETGL